MNRLRWLLCIWMLLRGAFGAAGPVMAEPAALPDGLAIGGTGKVIEVIDGDTLALEDGRQVRLVGIQAPKLPLGRFKVKAWPLADRARGLLKALALGQVVQLGYGGARLDRHGRVLAHLGILPAANASEPAGGLWLQGEMLRRGLARTYSFADNRALVAEMLRLEEDARRGGRGIWSHPFYAVRAPDELGAHIGSFQLVVGRVLQVASVRGRIYLNFGSDWETDFTVTLDPKTRRLFESEGIDPAAYEGRNVRVRGWIKSFNGPMIDSTHPDQIELLP